MNPAPNLNHAPTTAEVTSRRMTADEERELLRRWRVEGDEQARALLVQRLLPFVRRIAQGFAGRGEPLDDLVQVGAIGLINAIDRFDMENGGRLTTFAAPNISGEIKRHFRDRGWAVRVPRSLQELHAKIRTATKRMSDDLGRSPTVMELAAALEATEEEILEAMDAGRNFRTASLDEPASADDEHRRRRRSARWIRATRTPSIVRWCSRGCGRSTQREQRIMQLRYGGDLAQHEIAGEIGISQMQVSRLLRRSVEDMREAVGAQTG